MDTNGHIFKKEVKIDPVEMHEGLRELIDDLQKELENKHLNIIKNLKEKLNSRFCSVCFFGKPCVEAFGERLCKDCADNMYKLVYDGKTFPSLHKKSSYEWWVRRCRQRVNEALYDAYVQIAEKEADK